MAEILRGASVAAAISDNLRGRVQELKSAGITPTLALLRVGERADDIAYENAAVKRCENIGIAVRRFTLLEDCAKQTLLDTVTEINGDESIHGCLMFRPLPDRAAEAEACALLATEKDVDGMTAGSLAGVFTGSGAGYPPCTAQACIELLAHYGVELCGKNAVVVGRSLVIGKPVSMLLQAANATVTMCHTKTENMAEICRRADIIVAAAGRAGIVTDEFLTEKQTVVDVGINVTEDGNLVGDVRFDEAERKVRAITPVPGGVGSVTTAVLAKHVVEAAEKAAQ
ncbi:MAG: bifunctional 5,10-methylenetetrahydrofolate dehydrogenase/5,10-methenyltetrahydrofolate cyclohydrolase [Oscillospiraceae bacterium]|nr:bifunctional 5,10-methylenetetrahydrofolate dehydrogenase/5,10-methenyltetrahydrofolate cyclohydrolase [Oscillospiraceae bacterium]